MHMRKAVIFDWSGTLSNNFDSFVKIAAGIWRDLGKEPISASEMRKHFTIPYMRFYNRYFPDLTIKQQEKLYLKHAKEHYHPKLFDGVREALELLRERKWHLFIVSSDSRKTFVPEITGYGLADYFENCYVDIHDKAEVIASIIKDYRLDKAYYVGDTAADVEAGRKACAVTVAITQGYQDKKILKSAEPDHMIGRISELDTLLK
jgi:phosphoglycolate phosphatase